MSYKIALYDKETGKFLGYSRHSYGGVNSSFGAYGRPGGNRLFKDKTQAQGYIKAAKYTDFKAKVVEVKRKSPVARKRTGYGSAYSRGWKPSFW